MRSKANAAFTLVELLVVIAIIGVLVAMMVPAIQASREVARRNQCQHNLARLLLAMQDYEGAFEAYPAGVVNPDGPIRSEPLGLHQAWTIALLPYLDEGNAYRQIDLSKSVYDPANAQVRSYWPTELICPSEPDDIKGASNYAGCHHDVESPIAADNSGVLFLGSHVRREDIRDGISHTFFLGEKRSDADDLGWMSGTRATLRNTGLGPNDPAYTTGPRSLATPQATYVGGFASAHVGGLLMGVGDAGVRFVTDQIDPLVWRRLANRADGNLVDSNPLD